ncbi:MAG: PTS sugar transporter subunit IIB [Thermosphaera sp.]
MSLRYVLNKTLKVLTVCGVGQGSSLLMKMFAEDVFRDLKIPAKVESTEILTAKTGGADIIICSILHEPELKDSAPIVIGLKNLIDKKEMKNKLVENLLKKGWVKEG